MIAGIDIGSRSIELVIMNGDRVVHQDKTATTFHPIDQVRKLLNGFAPSHRGHRLRPEPSG